MENLKKKSNFPKFGKVSDFAIFVQKVFISETVRDGRKFGITSIIMSKMTKIVVIRGYSLSVVICGYSWLFVVTRGYSWLYMVIRGYPCICGYLWLYVIIRGYSCICGYLWLYVVICGYTCTCGYL